MYRTALAISGLGAALLFAASMLAAQAHGAEQPNEDWSFRIGAGALVAPDYEGSDDVETGLLPDFEINWRDRVTLSTEGVLVTPVRSDGFTLGVGVAPIFGREEDANAALNGMGDVDAGAAARLVLGYEWQRFAFSADFRQDVTEAHEGGTIELSAAARFRALEDRLRLSVGPSVTWASDNYMQTYFGIDATQAAASGYAQSEVEAGFKSVGLNLTANYGITESISATGLLGYSRLLGEAADSVLVDREGSANQFSGGLLLSYSF